MKEKEVLIIIPAYNEAANIGKVLDQLEKPEISDIADILVMNERCIRRCHKLACEGERSCACYSCV